MDFGQALAALKDGGRVTRAAWADGVFLYLVPGSTFQVNRPPLLGIYPAGEVIRYRPHVDIRAKDGTCSPWQPAQDALMAEDWETVPDADRCCDLHGRNCEPPSELCCEECAEARHSGWTDERGTLRHGHPRGEKCSAPNLSDMSHPAVHVTVPVTATGPAVGSAYSDPEFRRRLQQEVQEAVLRYGDGDGPAGASVSAWNPR